MLTVAARQWWVLIVQGLTEVYPAWQIRREVPGDWFLALIGILRFIGGLIILAMPIIGAILTVTILAVWSFLGGLAAISLGLRLRGLAGGDRRASRPAGAQGS